jgi:RES domain-containing protein
MPALWRIATDTADYGSDDLMGKGAQVTGGRWNRKGVPMIYASTSIALACLETLVHLKGGLPLPLNRYLVRIDLPQASWDARTVFDPAAHVGWDAEPPGLVSLDWGTHWTQGRSSVLAQVPSIVVPEEPNVLIHSRHPDLVGLTATKVRKWTYDPRLGT